MTTLELTTDNASDSSSFTAIVAAIITDTSRSSGSLDNASTSTDSNTSVSSSLSAPSLETSHSTSSSTTSAASSTNPSPCPSILVRSNSSLTFPSSSGQGSTSSSPNVTFAPLPQLEPRKRNSSRQLGIAARSQLLRHRRMLREQGMDPHSVPYYQYGPGTGVVGGQGYPEDGGPVEIRDGQAGVDGDEDLGSRSRGRSSGDPSEDPLVSLGKLVKVAGKSLWKSLSMRDLRSKEREAADRPVQEGAEGHGVDEEADAVEGQGQLRRGGSLREKKKTTGQRTEAVHLFDDNERSPHPEEGGVWEEEIEQDSWKKLLSDTPAPPVPPVPPLPESKVEAQPRSSFKLERSSSKSKRAAKVEAAKADSSRQRTR